MDNEVLINPITLRTQTSEDSILYEFRMICYYVPNTEYIKKLISCY
jgi:hypothetical protein